MATRDEIKAYFQTGDVPTQAQYEETFDSIRFLSDEGAVLSSTITVTHAELIAMQPFEASIVVATVPAGKYAVLINAVFQKNFVAGYTGAYVVLQKADDVVDWLGQYIDPTSNSNSIAFDQAGQRSVVQLPYVDYFKLFGGDLVLTLGNPTPMTGGHVDNILKVTAYYTLVDAL